MSPAICNYALAFLLTITLETAVAWLLGYRRRLEMACVVAVNLFSHPLLGFLVWIAPQWLLSPLSLPHILLLEAGVVVIEWLLMCFALPQHSPSRLLFLSLAMNSVSYLAGYFIPWKWTSPANCSYAIAFLLTITLEMAVAWLLGYRRRLEMACVVAVNVFSFPLLAFLIWILPAPQALLTPLSLLQVLPLVIGVVVVAWLLLCFALPQHSRSKLLFLSLVLNGISYLAGWFVPPMSPDAHTYAIVFLLTIAVEMAVAWLLGYRRRLEVACVVAVGVFSYPLLAFLMWKAPELLLSPFRLPQMSSVSLLQILLLEAGVAAVEWLLMCYGLPQHSRSKLFCLSLVMNGASCLAGCFIPWQ